MPEAGRQAAVQMGNCDGDLRSDAAALAAWQVLFAFHRSMESTIHQLDVLNQLHIASTTHQMITLSRAA